MSSNLVLEQLRKTLDQEPRRNIHATLVSGIEDAIADRSLQPGDLLPSERELSVGLGVSRNVVRRAIATLEAEGIVATRHGHGTFVPRELRKSTNSILGFTEEMNRRGLSVTSHVVRMIERVPTAQESIDLGINPDDLVREIVRVRLAGGTPIAHEFGLVPSWAISPAFDANGSLYAEMDARGTRPVRVLQEISAFAADPEVAESLAIEPGSPVLRITRKGLDKSNAVSEFTISHFRSDRYTWITELRR
ncbi:GntR family transcriptional regulator [Mesorhizobium sp. M0047]|uniref:GntR family transcriptional regulator n=1 Tax=Mesorhizobium sp. M0047 TaxID=2956859 RepID=UPI00333C0E0E